MSASHSKKDVATSSHDDAKKKWKDYEGEMITAREECHKRYTRPNYENWKTAIANAEKYLEHNPNSGTGIKDGYRIHVTIPIEKNKLFKAEPLMLLQEVLTAQEAFDKQSTKANLDHWEQTLKNAEAAHYPTEKEYPHEQEARRNHNDMIRRVHGSRALFNVSAPTSENIFHQAYSSVKSTISNANKPKEPVTSSANTVSHQSKSRFFSCCCCKENATNNYQLLDGEAHPSASPR